MEASGLLLFFIVFLLASSHLPFSALSDDTEVEDERPFSYKDGTGVGPSKWGEINPDWRICNTGNLQSPIDLTDGRVKIFPGLGKLQRHYKPAFATLKNRGHDLEMKWEGDAGHIVINGTVYNLQQCHWHSPAEHTFNGTRYALELHAVHQSSQGKIAVVAITYKYGHPDPFLTKIKSHIATLEEEEEKDFGVVNFRWIAKFGSRKYYRYIGSLTTPPCTEGVIWTISEKVRTVSREQVRSLRDMVHDGSEENTRPIQERDGRTVLLYTPRLNGDRY